MGGKNTLLRGALGEILKGNLQNHGRFVDLFAGSAAVTHHVAESFDTPVLSVDLQAFSSVLAGSVIFRDRPLGAESLVLRDWVSSARAQWSLADSRGVASVELDFATRVDLMRADAADSTHGFITRHYGGHYFSVDQSTSLDRLFATMPVGLARVVAQASLIRTASRIAASPGHTAQPFQPGPKRDKFIQAAWSIDVFDEVERQVSRLSTRYAKRVGVTRTDDANIVAAELDPGDLVFCDPPYSAVQYSRFYHVLEGIALGGWSAVEGAGRAPALQARASSDYSRTTRATGAISDLLEKLRAVGCSVILTFPDTEASNGLSGQKIADLADRAWNVDFRTVAVAHSTLGGQGANGRNGRRKIHEAVIVLKPR
jgi:adenine-specific DNA-methyltransferase